MTHHSRMLRFCTLVVVVSAALAGCSASGEPGSVPFTLDAGCDDGCDAAPTPMMPDDAGIVRSAYEGPPADSLTGGISPEDRAACYDGQDNDGDHVFDCGAPNCASLPSCCVGATSLACCGPLDTGATMDLAGCSGSLDTCGPLVGIAGFGTPSPTITGDRFYPNGDTSNDSGLVLTRAQDPRRALVVSGIVATPVGDCPAGCFENIALGLIPVGTPGALTTVRPLAAVVASAARSEVALVLGGETAGRIPLVNANELSVRLVVLPTGVVTLTVQDALSMVEVGALSGRIVPSAVDLQLAVYGHNVNRSPGAAPASYARAVSLSTALCDAPSRWLGRTPISIGTTVLEPVGSASAPSFTYAGGETFVAFASRGELVFGRADGVDLSTGFALLAANRRFAIPDAELSDPEVLYNESVGGAPASYTVYYANRTVGSIERIRIGLDGSVYDAPTPWLNSSLDEAFIESVDGPSVLRPLPATSGFTHVFVRVHTTTGETRIVHFALETETTPFAKPAEWDDITVRTTQADFGAFDRDEVASPAAYRQNGTIQVAFAGRNGARWGLGLMATDDPAVALWRRAPAPTILMGDGSGFDALSVRDPAIVSRDTHIEMLYTGSDGVTDTLGYARREATNHLPGGP